MAIDGAILLNLLAAGVLTFVFGAVALRLLQRAMVRHMMLTAGRAPPVEAAAKRLAAAHPLEVVVQDAEGGPEPTGPILRRMIAAHVAAGFAFAVVTTVLLFTASGMEFLPLRTTVVVWAFAWPTVLVLNFLIGPDRLRQLVVLGIYFGFLAVLCARAHLIDTPALMLAGVSVPGFVQPFVLWAIHAVPTVFLLLFLNRTIRTIGPVAIVFVFVLIAGGQLAVSLFNVPEILSFAASASVATGLGAEGVFWLVFLCGMTLAAWPAWRCAAFLRDRYSAKRTSDLLMTASAIWLLEALFLSFSLARDKGALGAAAALLPLIAWRLTLFLGLHPVVKRARTRPPLRLLLLRVFGFGRRTRRLLDLLGARWRLIGSIDLIAAPDLASRAIEPASFMSFLRGRLADLFIQTGERMAERFAALDHEADPDARYRVNPLFCGNDMWKEAVIRLMGEASLVVMDLRGFGPQRRGCVYEIQTLMDIVRLDRLVFLVDRTTDRAGLEAVVIERWSALSADSPNIATTDAKLRLIDTSGSDAVALLRLLSSVELPGSQ